MGVTSALTHQKVLAKHISNAPASTVARASGRKGCDETGETMAMVLPRDGDDAQMTQRWRASLHGGFADLAISALE
jgi:hypothetical protein